MDISQEISEYKAQKEEYFINHNLEPISGNFPDTNIDPAKVRYDSGIDELINIYKEHFEIDPEKPYLLKIVGDWREKLPLIFYLSLKKRLLIAKENLPTDTFYKSIDKFDFIDSIPDVQFVFEGYRWTSMELNYLLLDLVFDMIAKDNIVRVGFGVKIDKNTYKNRLWEFVNNIKDGILDDYSDKWVEYDKHAKEMMTLKSSKHIDDIYWEGKYYHPNSINISGVFPDDNRLISLDVIDNFFLEAKSLKSILDIDLEKNMIVLASMDEISYGYSLPYFLNSRLKEHINKIVYLKKAYYSNSLSLDDKREYDSIQEFLYDDFKVNWDDRSISLEVVQLSKFIQIFCNRLRYFYLSLDEDVRDNIKIKVQKTFNVSYLINRFKNSHLSIIDVLESDQDYFIYSLGIPSMEKIRKKITSDICEYIFFEKDKNIDLDHENNIEKSDTMIFIDDWPKKRIDGLLENCKRSLKAADKNILYLCFDILVFKDKFKGKILADFSRWIADNKNHYSGKNHAISFLNNTISNVSIRILRIVTTNGNRSANNFFKKLNREKVQLIIYFYQ